MDYTHLQQIKQTIHGFTHAMHSRGLEIEQPRLNEILIRCMQNNGFVRMLATTTGITAQFHIHNSDGEPSACMQELVTEIQSQTESGDPIDAQFIDLFDDYYLFNTTITIDMKTHRAIELMHH